MATIKLEDGKYELTHDETTGSLRAYRYGEPWADFTGNKFLYLLMVEALKAQPAEPYLHIYEYDTPFGLHREFTPREWNGSKPTRTVALYAAAPAPAPKLTREEILRAAVAAMPGANPLVADDLIGGHTMHTEADDIVAIWNAAARAAP